MSPSAATGRRLVVALCLAAVLVAAFSPAWGTPALLPSVPLVGPDATLALRADASPALSAAPHLPEPAGRGPPRRRLS